MLITKAMAERIVASGLDIVSFSLAGSSSKNDVVRKDTSIKHVLEAMEWVRNERERQGVSTPRIHVAYLLLKSLAPELKALPGLIAQAGGERIVISTLSIVPDSSLATEVFSSMSELKEALLFLISNREWVSLVEIECETKIEQRGKLPASFSRCPEMPTEAFFVGSDGRVTPCVFLGLPLKRFANQVVSLNFGSLAFSHPKEIWQRPSYRTFRESFAKGGSPFPCFRCVRLNTTYSAVIPEK
jgi:MoaA/NifB/PqqE/SkfB family radical SAM enzyme